MHRAPAAATAYHLAEQQSFNVTSLGCRSRCRCRRVRSGGHGRIGHRASSLGAKVVILEKAPEGQEGGNTRVAGQGYLNTSSAEQAIAYLTALCGPYTVPEAMVKVWAEEMCRNNAWLAGLGGDPQEHQHPPVGIEFPDLPGSDCVHKFHDGPTYGYSYTWQLFERLVQAAPDPHSL